MPTFTLVDLAGQFKQVVALLKGKSKTDVLKWLRQQGDVYELSASLDSYGFHSRLDIRTGFRVTEDGQLFLIEDHTINTLRK